MCCMSILGSTRSSLWLSRLYQRRAHLSAGGRGLLHQPAPCPQPVAARRARRCAQQVACDLEQAQCDFVPGALSLPVLAWRARAGCPAACARVARYIDCKTRHPARRPSQNGNQRPDARQFSFRGAGWEIVAGDWRRALSHNSDAVRRTRRILVGCACSRVRATPRGGANAAAPCPWRQRLHPVFGL